MIHTINSLLSDDSVLNPVDEWLQSSEPYVDLQNEGRIPRSRSCPILQTELVENRKKGMKSRVGR